MLVDMFDMLIKRGTWAVSVTFPFRGYTGHKVEFTQYTENGWKYPEVEYSKTI